MNIASGNGSYNVEQWEIRDAWQRKFIVLIKQNKIGIDWKIF